MRKTSYVAIIALLALTVAGCTFPFGQSTPTPTVAPRPSDTTPGTVPTQVPPVTPTPSPAYWLDAYTEYKFGNGQNLPNGMKSTIEKIYHNDDYTLPIVLGSGKAASHHGVVYKVKFYNPTGTTQVEQLGHDMKSMIFYFDSDHQRRHFITSDVFYDEVTGKTSMDLSVAPGETKTVYIIAFISKDSDYDTHGDAIEWPPGMDTNAGQNF